MVCKKCGGETYKTVSKYGVLISCKKCKNTENGYQVTQLG